MGIRDRPTSPRSPWQNGYAEKLIGSIRRECLDHVVVFGERHLRHVLLSYMNYYNEARTHLSLDKDAPVTRAVATTGRILAAQFLEVCTINTSGSSLRYSQPQGTLERTLRKTFHVRLGLTRPGLPAQSDITDDQGEPNLAVSNRLPRLAARDQRAFVRSAPKSGHSSGSL